MAKTPPGKGPRKGPGGKTGGGPRKAVYKRIYEVGGTPDATELTVTIYRDGLLADKEAVWFYLGVEGNLHQKPAEELDPAAPGGKKIWKLETKGGVAHGRLDFTSAELSKFTHVTAKHGSFDWEETKTRPPAEPTGVKPKTKWFKLTPDDEKIETWDERAAFTLVTFDATGKTPSAETMRISAGKVIRLFNRETGALIGEGKVITFATPGTGILDIEVEVVGDFLAKLTFMHIASAETLTKEIRLK
ncbi:MAG: hypothetical protein HYV13_01815 [Candidatus Doudnabacteria bacterium]|nr:hypothetical protein [Candidatus Doudnabacteria bacterium]